MTHDETYLRLLSSALAFGTPKGDRTGTGTRSLFGYQMRFDLNHGFPLLTTKKVHWHSVMHELLWFISGETNVQYLRDNGVTIWDEWADEAGNLGPVYGEQWRRWNEVDQLQEAINTLRTDPDSRRIIVNAWNVSDIPFMALPPCHLLYQFYSHEYLGRRALSMQVYQRSADIFLGVPFNIASYALLLKMVAQVTGHYASELVWVGGDCHLYENHITQAETQLLREPLMPPAVRLDESIKEIDDFRAEHIQLLDYASHPAIKAPVAV